MKELLKQALDALVAEGHPGNELLDAIRAELMQADERKASHDQELFNNALSYQRRDA